MYDLLVPSLTPNGGDKHAVLNGSLTARQVSPHAAGSLPPLPPPADSSLTWCPREHDRKHVNSYGSSIKHWKCTETIGHGVFLHRNREKKETLAVFSTRLKAARTAMRKRCAPEPVPGRWIFWVNGKERRVTCLVTPKSTVLVLASTSILGNLTLLIGTRETGCTFRLAADLLGDLGAGFSLRVFSYLSCLQGEESISLGMTEGCQAGQDFGIFGAGLQAPVQRVHHKTLLLTSQFRLRQAGTFQ